MVVVLIHPVSRTRESVRIGPHGVIVEIVVIPIFKGLEIGDLLLFELGFTVEFSVSVEVGFRRVNVVNKHGL